MIKLINDFYIKVDRDQYTLIQIKEGKTKGGEPKETHIVYGYFGNLTACIKRCRQVMFAEEMEGLTLSLEEAIALLRELTERVEALIPEEVDK